MSNDESKDNLPRVPPAIISTTNEKEDSLIVSQVPCLWTIPRPALLRRPSSQLLDQYQSDLKPDSSASDGESLPASYLTSATTLSESYPDSTSSPSSTSSTQSGSSGRLFLTVANLAALRLENSSSYHGFQKGKQLDTASLASSTHFTLVNGMERWRRKPVKKCWCESHQLTALVTAMCVILSFIIFVIVYLTQMKINEPDRFS